MNGEINVVDPILLSKSIISEAFDTVSKFHRDCSLILSYLGFFYEDECEETVDDQKYSTVRTEIKQKIKKLVGDDSYFFELPSYNWGDQDFYVWASHSKNPMNYSIGERSINHLSGLFPVCHPLQNHQKLSRIQRVRYCAEQFDPYSLDIMIQIDESEVNGPLLHIYQLHKPLLNYEDFLHLCLEFLSKPCLLPPSSPFAPISLCPPLLKYFPLFHKLFLLVMMQRTNHGRGTSPTLPYPRRCSCDWKKSSWMDIWWRWPKLITNLYLNQEHLEFL